MGVDCIVCTLQMTIVVQSNSTSNLPHTDNNPAIQHQTGISTNGRIVEQTKLENGEGEVHTSPIHKATLAAVCRTRTQIRIRNYRKGWQRKDS